MNDRISPEKPTTQSNAQIVYILYLVSIIFNILGIVGVVMAYVNRSDAPDWLRSHYQFQIRTFWIGLLYFFIGVILTYVWIGVLILFFEVIWMIIRCVKGMKYLEQQEAHPNPTAWMF